MTNLTGTNTIGNDGIANKKMAKKAAFASMFGSLIEWYDFFLYGLAAALVFPKLFFTNSDPYVATLLSFGTFAVGFMARPVGAMIFGHYGDRIGRKVTLVVTLCLMGISSFLMGLIPSYSTIGLWAPALIIILRFIQGVGVGGEWGGAALLSMEWGDKKKKGFMASMPHVGLAMGSLLSSLMFSTFIKISGDGFITWGWRIPFLFSIVLLLIGLVIRAKVDETPTFRNVQARKQVSRMPVLEAFKKHPKEIILSALLRMSENAPFYVFTVFIISYSVDAFGIERNYLVNANIVASILMAFAIPFFGFLSDKVGIKRLYLIGVALTFVWAFPFVSLVNTGVPILIGLAVVLSMIPHNMQSGAQSALISQSFAPEIRYSGASIGYSLTSIIGGGIAPLICTYLIHTYGSLYAVGFYIAFTAVISFIAAALIKQRSEDDIVKNNVDYSVEVKSS